MTSDGRPVPSELPVIAVGWATVELDRAAAELSTLLEPGQAFEPAADSLVLGARCRVGRAAEGAAGARLIILLEPSTEGRLAAGLARRGEAWLATWRIDPLADPSRWSAGPLGPERLASEERPTASFHLLVRPATIDR